MQDFSLLGKYTKKSIDTVSSNEDDPFGRAWTRNLSRISSVKNKEYKKTYESEKSKGATDQSSNSDIVKLNHSLRASERMLVMGPGVVIVMVATQRLAAVIRNFVNSSLVLGQRGGF
ncbi:hypothetical protein EVAR_44673_1 [Eumeta japonica]|uniref:Uncharacterized protein n=1 Tax=Eumeta variegata TaxID=151549 RepID=A0A4C1Y514_EUMVA|nr:hypothetical protein EVAR_44673_1 [Eumeta japonica]